MASKKTFKDSLNPAELFISSVPEEREQPETKSRRLQLLIKPSTAEKLKRIATRAGTSVNDLINSILEEALK